MVGRRPRRQRHRARLAGPVPGAGGARALRRPRLRGALESGKALDTAGIRRKGRRPLLAARAARALGNVARRTVAPGRKPPSGAPVANLPESNVRGRAAAEAFDGAGALAFAARVREAAGSWRGKRLRRQHSRWRRPGRTAVQYATVKKDVVDPAGAVTGSREPTLQPEAEEESTRRALWAATRRLAVPEPRRHCRPGSSADG